MTAHSRTLRKLPLLIGAAAFFLAVPADAQPVARSFQELRGLVSPGDTIYVTDARGTTVKGLLVDLSDSSVVFRSRRNSSARLLRLPERDVNNIRVQRSDPWWNGPLIGLATGAIPGLLIELGGRSEYREVQRGGSPGARHHRAAHGAPGRRPQSGKTDRLRSPSGRGFRWWGRWRPNVCRILTRGVRPHYGIVMGSDPIPLGAYWYPCLRSLRAAT